MNQRRRVVHFVDSEVFGGTEQAMLTLFEGLDASRWELVLAHYPGEALAPLVSGAQMRGVETWSVPPMPPGFVGLRRLPRFATTLRCDHASLVHLHLTWPLACQYTLMSAALARVPAVVATVQLSFPLTLSRRVMLQQRLLTRGVDRYLAVSESVRRYLVHDLHWPPAKIEVVPNSVRANPAVVTPTTASTVRHQIVGRQATPLVLVPARLHEQKGHRYLFPALAEVPEAHVALAGEGPERHALEMLAHELGIESRVSFLGHRDDMPELLAAADLVVLPSLYEGLPISLLEAMAAAKPVIATRIGGTDELVTSGYDGLLVEPRDSHALAQAMKTLLSDPERARQMASSAQRTVADRFSAEVMCKRVSQVYGELLGD
jgi:glycosyltransferase involved in cell wall biosynthesis